MTKRDRSSAGSFGPRKIGFGREGRRETKTGGNRHCLQRVVEPRRTPRIGQGIDTLSGPRFEGGPAGLEFVLLHGWRRLAQRRVRRGVGADAKPFVGELPDLIRRHGRKRIVGGRLRVIPAERGAPLLVRQCANGVHGCLASGARNRVEPEETLLP